MTHTNLHEIGMYMSMHFCFLIKIVFDKQMMIIQNIDIPNSKRDLDNKKEY